MKPLLRALLFPLFILPCFFSASQTSVLLKNINQTLTGVNSAPTRGVWFSGSYYYAANDGTNGVELWKSDGTAAGTVLLRDINIGNGGSSPSNFTIVGATLFFTANDGINGSEIWKTDGTTAGTVILKDIRAGVSGCNPSSLVTMGSLLVFNANDGLTGDELWKSDGTAAGTVVIKEIIAGSGGSGINRVTTAGTRVFFSASSNANGNYELYVTDGTAVGTGLTKEIDPSLFVGGMQGATFGWNGDLYFGANNGTNGVELWKSDGTTAGTVMVKDIYSGSSAGNPSNFTVMNGKVYFTATDANGTELWVTDGTTGGTVMVKDINVGSANSSPSQLTAVGTTLYFRATTAAGGAELWKTDGTGVNTVIVKDINVGAGNSNPAQTAVVGADLYFQANDNVNGAELWKTDGTALGTVIIRDINTAVNVASTPINVVSNGSIVLFSADNGSNGTELWKSNGTLPGTILVKNISPETGISGIANVTALGSKVVFTATDGVNGTELWVSDGTTGATSLLKDINTSTAGASSSPSKLTVFNGNIYFSANNGTTVGLNGSELWKTDGTTLGTMMVKDINPGTSGSSPTNFTIQGSYLYFAATDASSGAELWRTDGSTINTVLVKDIVSGSGSSSPGSSGTFPAMFSTGAMLYFQAIDQSTLPGPGWELYSSTGAIGNGGLLKDINVTSGGANSAPDNFAYLGSGNTVYFIANDEVVGSELWKSDGTAGGTVLVKDITPGADGTTFSRMLILNNKMYFTAYSSTYGVELWQSDGTSGGTIVLKDINPGLGSSNPLNMTVCGNNIYFSADDGTNGRELWSTDGTAAGTVLVSDIVSGAGSSNPNNFFYHSVLGAVYFSAYTPANGVELWEYDGTAARLYSEATIGAGSTNPGPIMLAGNNLIYVGTNGAGGLELYGVEAYNCWKGSNGANWSDDTNWKKSLLPGITESALFPATGVITEATLDIDATVVRLEVEANRVLTLNSGKILTVADLVFNRGVIKGTGTLINLDVTNEGTIAPGSPLGILNMIGNFNNQGTLEINLGGLIAGSQYDRLAVTGIVSLDGTLDISLLNGFSPVIGQSFTIMTAVSVTGTFNNVVWPAGVTGTITYTATSVQINITGTLPLTLLNFTGRLNNNKGELKWKTADEVNTASFEVQRSHDGTNFTAVVVNIPAAGNGSHDYHATDLSPVNGNNYYRLKMKDRDGRFTYSNTVLIRLEDNGTVRLSPVPAISYVDITVADQSLIGQKAQVFDNTGKQILEIKLQASNTINVSGWVPGVYFVKTGTAKAIQFIKQ